MTSSEEVDNIAHELSNLDFHHPFTPYTVQNQFMRTVYQILQTGKGQVGILESPTGTVCLLFLRDVCIILLLAKLGDSRGITKLVTV
jgi:hypothetical protein